LDRSVWIRGFSAWKGPDWDVSLNDAGLFPRGKKGERFDHSLHVGYHDDHGLARIVCTDPQPLRPKP